jgi:hypothetical protein
MTEKDENERALSYTARKHKFRQAEAKRHGKKHKIQPAEETQRSHFFSQTKG